MREVKRRSYLGFSATILGSGLFAAKTGHGFQNGGQGATGSVHHHVHAVSVMTETANPFLAALSPDQRAKATFRFSADARMNWHFIPKQRKGLPLRDISTYQRHPARRILPRGVGRAGSLTDLTI